MHILVVDLEATCWQGHLPGTVRRQTVNDMEVLEIGCALATADGNVLDSASFLARPVLRPRLSEFCRELTGIRQQDADRAPHYGEAVAQLNAWLADKPAIDLWVSWGDYDFYQLEAEFYRNHCAPAFMARPHLNLKLAWRKTTGLQGRMDFADVLAHHRLDFEGRPHRGVDDARNAARLLRHIDSRYLRLHLQWHSRQVLRHLGLKPGLLRYLLPGMAARW